MSGFFKKGEDPKKNFGKANLIVLFFVLAHAITCYFLHGTSVGDGIFLTILTIMMVYALIRFYKVPFDVFLGLAFLACFAGFYIGTEGAKLLVKWLPSLEGGVWINVIMTSAVTELLGLIIALLIRKSWKKDQDTEH